MKRFTFILAALAIFATGVVGYGLTVATSALAHSSQDQVATGTNQTAIDQESVSTQRYKETLEWFGNHKKAILLAQSGQTCGQQCNQQWQSCLASCPNGPNYVECSGYCSRTAGLCLSGCD